MQQQTLVVGAGVAGLQCAADLRNAGRQVRVLERARSVGGRCATRRFEGQPVDFGPMFLHGEQPNFLAALGQVPGGGLETWPLRVEGGGPPCQVGALAPYVRRGSFADGLKAFPNHLATGLDIHLETTVTGLQPVPGGFQVTAADGGHHFGSDLVLALALPETLALLETLPASAELAGVQALLGLFSSLPCLTLIAGYPLDTPAPPWDLLYPRESYLLQLIAQDSSKRPAPRFRALVCQARPKWSRQHQEAPTATWAADLLREAAALAGPWILQPSWTHPHCWRHARVDPTNELAQPVLIQLPGGQRLGLAGDVFAPGGGVQAAWTSGMRLAQRLLAKETP